MKRITHIRNKLLLIFAVVLFSICTTFASTDKNTENQKSIPDVDQKAPGFSLPGLGEQIELAKLEGSVVYVDFWASWCKPCKKSFSWMNAMQDRYGKDGFKIIAINLDSTRQDANTFLEQYPASFSIAFDPDGYTAELYQVKGMPSSYLISRDGNIAYRHLGFRPNDKQLLEAAIEHMVRSL